MKSSLALASLALLLLPGVAGAHPQRDERIYRAPVLPGSVRLEASDHRLLAIAQGYAPNAVVVEAVDQQALAWVCVPGQQCAPVSGVRPCVPSESEPYSGGPPECPEGWVVVEYAPVPTLVVVEQPAPPPPPPAPTPCRPRMTWAAATAGGLEFAVFDGLPRAGANFAPGFRRAQTAPPSQSRSDPCALSVASPSLWLGTQYGLDFRGRVAWALTTPREDFTFALAIMPVGRIAVANGRLLVPSILGALIPEVGIRGRLRPIEP
ncbi:MAG: hypothetical protein WCJ30_27195, partial [Deltaproteobacteria bacterium]